MTALSLLFGGLVGLSLGLTGGGGAIFAVPLLVYGLQLHPKEAVSISLAAVGATSLVGFFSRWRLGEVELRTGLLFAVAGMLGAPAGAWIANQISEAVLLTSFSLLMLVISGRLWYEAGRVPAPVPANCPDPEALDGPTCRRDAQGNLLLTSRCALLLLVVGLITGVFSGLFGVGGGFLIVPALIVFSGMSIQRAVGTSLMVIALVSATGLAAQLGSGRSLHLTVATLFVLGGILGLFAGQRIGRQMSSATLKKVFSVAVLLVAIYMIVRNLGQ
jgi:uncharacterized membrane protein YfcA